MCMKNEAQFMPHYCPPLAVWDVNIIENMLITGNVGHCMPDINIKPLPESGTKHKSFMGSLTLRTIGTWRYCTPNQTLCIEHTVYAHDSIPGSVQ